MAVISSANRSVPLYVLIIFVVLFLISTTGLVLMFVNHETLRQEAQTATTTFDEYIGMGVKSNLEPFRAMGSAAKPKRSAVGALLDDRNELARMITGNPASTTKDVADKIDAMAAALPAPVAAKFKEQAKTNLIGAVQQAMDIAQNVSKENAELRNLLTGCQQEKDTIQTQYKDLETKFTANTQKVLGQLSSLQSLFDSYKKEVTEQFEAIKTQVNKEQVAKAEDIKKKVLLDMDEMRDMIRRNLQVLIKSTAELGPAELRAAAGMTVDQLTQKVDAQVLDIAGPVIYIDLGEKQGIQTGIRFAVIEATQRSQANPSIKGVLEVTNVGDMTSECRVVASAPGNPVLKGDLLINLVYDRELKLNFFVMGDFDVNDDGFIDPNGAEKVAEIITSAGGKVSRQLSPTVNFVVQGAAPEAPKLAAGATPTPAEAKQIKRAREYADHIDQIKALAIPVISAETFLKYTGYSTNFKQD